MSLEYSPLGLVGMLTPQANTTVEPEFNLLWPPGVAMINARLMSDKASMSDRLVDYFATYAQSLRQFANAPIGVAAAACTGASYLAGREREAKLVVEIEQQHGFAFLTAALAVVDAFRVLNARRIGLVSPYPDDLNQASVAYWQSHGLEVAAIASAYDASNKSFHPIYSMAGSAAEHAARSLQSTQLDAIVMLGTGMPTLRPLAALLDWDGPPVMSCNLCLAWRAVEALRRREPDAATLRPWLRGEGWAQRLQAQTAA
jgi:maleate isomerase